MEALVLLILITAYVLHRKLKKENQKLRERNVFLEPLAEANQELERLRIEAKEKLYQAELKEKAAQEYMSSVVSEAQEQAAEIIKKATAVSEEDAHRILLYISETLPRADVKEDEAQRDSSSTTPETQALDVKNNPDMVGIVDSQEIDKSGEDVPVNSEPKEVRRNRKPHELKGKSLTDFPDEFCVVDLETTGLDPEDDSIIEIGAIKYLHDKAVDGFQSLINSEVKISKKITSITGITNEMLEDAPKADSVLPLFHNFLGDSLIIGYNASFDVGFLHNSYKKYLGVPLKNDFIDLLKIARRLYPDLRRHRLRDLVEYLEIETTGLHRALGDCEATFACYEDFKYEIMSRYGTFEEFSRRARRKRRVYKNAETASYTDIYHRLSDLSR